MTVFTLFGMLVLTMASVTMDDGLTSTDSQMNAEPTSKAESLKEAA